MSRILKQRYLFPGSGLGVDSGKTHTNIWSKSNGTGGRFYVRFSFSRVSSLGFVVHLGFQFIEMRFLIGSGIGFGIAKCEEFQLLADN